MTTSVTTVKGAPLVNARPAPTSTPPESWMLRPTDLSWQYPSARRRVGFSISQDVIEVVATTHVVDDPALDW